MTRHRRSETVCPRSLSVFSCERPLGCSEQLTVQSLAVLAIPPRFIQCRTGFFHQIVGPPERLLRVIA